MGLTAVVLSAWGLVCCITDVRILSPILVFLILVEFHQNSHLLHAPSFNPLISIARLHSFNPVYEKVDIPL